MRPLLLLSSLFAATAQAQTYNPTERYVVLGQDDAGYRSWYFASPVHPIRVAGFHHYLSNWDVAWILPTWQIIRTASDWNKCNNPAFEVPPTSEWPHIVQTLRYVRDEVIPAIGPVEAVSAYRNPVLNECAGGAPGSAHTGFYALDLVPLKPIDREALIRTMCTVHYRRGEAYSTGLGFYAFHRFHVDSMGFREWGPAGQDSPCLPIEAELKATETAKPARQ
jgi:hypothetical protein